MTQKWDILGAGAIGTLFACKLHRAGIPVRLLLRAESASDETPVILREGETRRELPIEKMPLDQLKPSSIEALIVSTKANQAVAALEEAIPQLAEGAPVILLHNGMGVYERVTSEHPELNLYCGTTTEGAWRDKDGSLVHAGAGETLIGHPGLGTRPEWFFALQDGGEGFIWEPEIESSMWRKLMINCAINPLTAINRCYNGDLLENFDLRRQAETICEELAAVTRARGDERLAEQVREEAFAVMNSTAQNHSSMLQDVMHGRITEIEYITGYFCHEAQRVGVPCPANQALLEQVRRLDSKSAAT